VSAAAIPHLEEKPRRSHIYFEMNSFTQEGLKERWIDFSRLGSTSKYQHRVVIEKELGIRPDDSVSYNAAWPHQKI